MSEPMSKCEKIDNQKGLFGKYTVMGFKYRDEQSRLGWHITSWLTGFGPVHDYWVSGKDFHSASFHYFYRGTPVNLVQIYYPALTTEIEQAERDAVLEAIASWEKAEAATV